MAAIGKSGEQRRESSFYKGKEGVGRVILNKSPLEGSKSAGW